MTDHQILKQMLRKYKMGGFWKLQKLFDHNFERYKSSFSCKNLIIKKTDYGNDWWHVVKTGEAIDDYISKNSLNNFIELL